MGGSYYSLQEFRGKALQYNDLMRTYLFQVIIDAIPKKFGTSPGAIGKDDIIYFVSKTNFPEMTSEEIKVPWMNSDIKLAGRTSFGDWNVTVRDTRNGDVFKFFRKWHELNFSISPGYNTEVQTGAAVYANDMVGKFTLILLDPTGAESSMKLHLYNVWVAKVGGPSLSMGDNNIAEFEVNLKFDYFTVE